MLLFCIAIFYTPVDIGNFLASGNNDNTVKLWRRDVDYLLKEGCSFMGKYFKNNPPDSEEDKHLCDDVR